MTNGITTAFLCRPECFALLPAKASKDLLAIALTFPPKEPLGTPCQGAQENLMTEGSDTHESCKASIFKLGHGISHQQHLRFLGQNDQLMWLSHADHSISHLVAEESLWGGPCPGASGNLMAERGDAHESGKANIRKLRRAISCQQHVGALQIQHDHLKAVQIVETHQHLIRHLLSPDRSGRIITSNTSSEIWSGNTIRCQQRAPQVQHSTP